MKRTSKKTRKRKLSKTQASGVFAENGAAIGGVAVVDRSEALEYLRKWAPLRDAVEAIEFLGFRFADSTVRRTAVRWLDEGLSDEQLVTCLPQLAQCLKHEVWHNSQLSRFLIRRALANPSQVGHCLFWHLHARIRDSQCTERFALILEELLTFGCELSRQLAVDSEVVNRIAAVSSQMCRLRLEPLSKEVYGKHLSQRLRKLGRHMPAEGFLMPLNPKWKVGKLLPEKCRLTNSRKPTLFLTFANCDKCAAEITVSYSSAKQWKQQSICAQLIAAFNQLWLKHGLNLGVIPNRVLCLGVDENGEDIGLAEVRTDAETINDISNQFGGNFRNEIISDYLQFHNRGEIDLKRATSKFTRSTAGWCVATYALGISDRHNEHLLVARSGEMIHTGMRHFLSDERSHGFSLRSRNTLVFTQHMANVIAARQRPSRSAEFKAFLQLVGDATNVLRVNCRFLSCLVALMTDEKLPELKSDSDAAFVTRKLFHVADDSKMYKSMQKRINDALKGSIRIFDFR